MPLFRARARSAAADLFGDLLGRGGIPPRISAYIVHLSEERSGRFIIREPVFIVVVSIGAPPSSPLPAARACDRWWLSRHTECIRNQLRGALHSGLFGFCP